MGQVLLFVYGSLKRGCSNHYLIAEQEFLGPAITEPRYRLIDLGMYPGLVRNEANGLAVHGELWAVSEDCLVELDRFEGEPYQREPVAIPGSTDVVAYFWKRTIPVLGRSGHVWPFVG